MTEFDYAAGQLLFHRTGWWRLFESFVVRMLDLGLTLVLTVLLLPMMGLAVAWILLVDFGNPFYVQTRIGLHGTPFRMFKLRTMRRAAPGCQPAFCTVDDPRILPGARWLRRMRLDETPQFLNVFKGEMSLVGPRPEQPEFVTAFRREIRGYDERHDVRPGITGLAQVRLGYVDSVQGTRHKLRYDRFYVQKLSISLWGFVVMQTCLVVTRLAGR